MSISERKRNILLTVCSAVGCFWYHPVVPPPAAAAELEIIECVQIDFGGVVDESGTVTLGLDDTILHDPAHIHLGGFPSSGLYAISGDPDTAIQINITAPDNGGMKLSAFMTSEGPPPLLGTALGHDGQLDLSIGASLTIDGSQVQPGMDQSIGFTISLVYN